MDRQLANRGLTTIETLVAIGIVSITLLAIMALFTASFRSVNQTSELTNGVEIARELIESVKVLGREAPPPVDGIYKGSIPTPQEESGFPPAPYPEVERGGVRYTLQVTVAPAPGTTRAKAITVEVTWKDGGRTELQTFL